MRSLSWGDPRRSRTLGGFGRSVGMCSAILFSLLLATTARGEDDPFGSTWPEGPGREEAGYLCGACHSLRLVTQQGLSRSDWDETLDWMVEEQEMEPLESDERELILTYLSTHFGTDHRPAHVQPQPGSLPAIR